MTLEELFVEKYKKLENENEKLSQDTITQDIEIKKLRDKIEEYEKMLHKLNDFIVIRKSSYDNSHYLYFDNYIYDKSNKELFDFLSHYKKIDDEGKEGEE